MLIRINNNIETAIYTWLLIALVYSILLFGYITTVLSLVLFITWILFSKKNFDLSSVKIKLVILFASLYLIYIVGLIYTKNVWQNASAFEAKSAIFIFPLIFGTTTILNRPLLEKITTHFLIATTIACAAAVSNVIYNYCRPGDPQLLTGESALFFTGFRPFLMGLYCLTAISVAFEKINAGAKIKSIFFACIVLFSIIIFLLSIRMIIVGWFALVLYYTLMFANTRKQKLLAASIPILTVIIASIAISSVRNQWKEFFDRTGRSQIVLDQDSSLGKNWGGKALRVAIWKCSADILKDHWFIGVGTGDVQQSLQQAYENRKFYFASRYNRYNAHNQYIQISLATGLPGLIILLSCIIYPLRHYQKKFLSKQYLIFIVLFAFICFSESVLEANKGVVWYSFFNSIFAFGYLKSGIT